MLVDEMLWVLRNARRHAADPGLRTASGFAAGAGRAPAVHRAQVGRWESGAVEITQDLVRRYEIVLGLPEGQLLCAIDQFARNASPVRSTAALNPREDPDVDETLQLVERAVAPERMTGHDWDRLSANLGRMPHAMVRAGDWEHLMRRCIHELVVTVGLEYDLRAEAVARLAGHPRSGAVVADMVRDILDDPRAQFYNDTMSLLQFTTHPAALRILLDELSTPTNPDALRACLIALTSLVTGDHLTPGLARAAAHLAIGHLRDSRAPYRVHRGAANLLRALELPGRTRLAQALTAEDRSFAASIILEGRAVPPETLRRVRRRVRAAVDESQPEPDGEPVLYRLLDTALGHTDEMTRSNALSILMISPQGQVVGREYAAELATARAEGDVIAAHECCTVLTWLGRAEDLPLFIDMACSPETGPEMVAEVGVVAGNCVEPRTPVRAAREARCADRLRHVLHDNHAADPNRMADCVRGLTYILGMRGRFDTLAALSSSLDHAADHAVVNEVAQPVLGWWLSMPAHIRPEA
ncbi:hypothetical protein N865_19065 [Intrasporangium oryzae NRRL B-24470]|uniref:HTH cro/C1-type domain-containing protein n=1 Tax=Intrasporangium oryzae NRRL B-24470 TaxID=1386089 RepID=W9GHK6_9MICO|nr:helix-turn-helix transcriptional regulator [Intrasporangium oryzae]EWT03374.1 hypothetical protein N865_19065 [Intrasporangium oryzae NRRL B-24470]